MCAPRRGLAPPGVCHCALISYRIQRNKYHNPKQQWGNAMAVTPTPITKMTFGWYMIYDTTMTGREKYPYVIAIRETLPWSENSKTPGMKKIKPPSSRLGASSFLFPTVHIGPLIMMSAPKLPAAAASQIRTAPRRGGSRRIQGKQRFI